MPAMLRAAFHSKDLNLLSTSLLKMNAEEAQYWMSVARQTGIWNLEEDNRVCADVDPRRENNNNNIVVSSSSSPSNRVLFSTPFQHHQQQREHVATSPQREREILLEISAKLATKNHRFREALRFYLGNPKSLDMTCEQFGDALNRMNIAINREEFQSLVSKCSGGSSGRVDYTKLQALIASYETQTSSPIITSEGGFATPVSSNNTTKSRILLPSGRRGRQNTKREVAPWDK